jgi:AraC-like DNA-binding protein
LLAAHVEYLWQLRDVPGHSTERVLPSGTLELVINLARDEFQIRTESGDHARRGVIVSGAYERFFTIATRDHADVLGVHFKPGGAWPVLGVPPGALADQHCNLEDLWGAADARRLREQLLECLPERRLLVLEAALNARCSCRWQQHPACVVARNALARGARVTEVAAASGLSARRLQTLFREQVGTTPKVFARICRFQRAFGKIQRAVPDWPQLAMDTGYCDQSHMIREFQEIAGSAPTELTRAPSVPVKENHVASR